MRTVAVLPVYAAALVLGLYQTFRPTFESGFARAQTELCDGMLNHYILEHSWQAVSNPGYRGSLFSPPCFFPEKYTLFYSEHLLGVAPVYWALRLGLPADLAYQWWQILMAVPNFVAAAAVMRWLRQPHVLAVLGGYLWAFALVHIDQIKHQQMIARFWMPLALYHAWAFASAPAARNLNRMLACVFLQSLACVYSGWFLATGLAVFLPAAVGLRPGGWADVKQFVAGNRRKFWAIVLGWGLALAASFVPYVLVNWGIMRSYTECLGLIPTPAAWFTGPPGCRWDAVLDPPRTQPHPYWVADECWLFCGFGIDALMLATAVYLLAFRRADRPPETVLVAAGLLTAALWVLLTLALYNGGPSLWWFVRMLPGGGAIRCVSRVYTTVYLFGGTAALVWLGLVTARLRPGVRLAVLSAIAGAVIFEQTGYLPPSFEKPDFYAVVDRTAERLRGAEAAYVVPHYTDTRGQIGDGYPGEVFAMWVGLRANVPVVNGYSGRVPGGAYPRPRVTADRTAWIPVTDDDLRVWLAGQFHGRLTIIDPNHLDATRVIVIE